MAGVESAIGSALASLDVRVKKVKGSRFLVLFWQCDRRLGRGGKWQNPHDASAGSMGEKEVKP